MSRLSEACKELSLASQILERASYKRAEGLARIKEAVKENDIPGAEKAADELAAFIQEYYRAEQGFVTALDACRHAWETRGEEL